MGYFIIEFKYERTLIEPISHRIKMKRKNKMRYSQLKNEIFRIRRNLSHSDWFVPYEMLRKSSQRKSFSFVAVLNRIKRKKKNYNKGWKLDICSSFFGFPFRSWYIVAMFPVNAITCIFCSQFRLFSFGNKNNVHNETFDFDLIKTRRACAFSCYSRLAYRKGTFLITLKKKLFWKFVYHLLRLLGKLSSVFFLFSCVTNSKTNSIRVTN